MNTKLLAITMEWLDCDDLTYIIVTSIILYSSIFNFYNSINYLLNEVTIMRHCNNSTLVLIYCLLKKIIIAS